MAMTIELLERVLVSEVDNLHVRVDILSGLVEKVEVRLGSVERKVDLLFIELSEVNQKLKGYVTKEDSASFATKEDLGQFATKEDLKQFATKEDLRRFATKKDLAQFATRDEVHRIVDSAIKTAFDALTAQLSRIEKSLQSLGGV